MAELTDLDLDCLEFSTGFLSGLVAASWGEPEKMFAYAARHAGVSALLGRVKEHGYYAGIARTSAAQMGVVAQKAWDREPLLRRIAAGRAGRLEFLRAYTADRLSAADSRLAALDADAATYRNRIRSHFTKAGARR